MAISELVTSYPIQSIIIISLIVTFVLTLVTKFFTDQKRIKEIKEKQKACQKLMKDFKDDPKKMMEIQKDVMACSTELMKHSFRPMLITFIPLIFLWRWLTPLYGATSIAKSWIWWYIISSVIFSIISRKVLKVE